MSILLASADDASFSDTAVIGNLPRLVDEDRRANTVLKGRPLSTSAPNRQGVGGYSAVVADLDIERVVVNSFALYDSAQFSHRAVEPIDHGQILGLDLSDLSLRDKIGVAGLKARRRVVV